MLVDRVCYNLLKVTISVELVNMRFMFESQSVRSSASLIQLNLIVSLDTDPP